MLIDHMQPFRFGAFTAEPLKGRVTGDDMRPRHLPPKAMEVLVSLARSAPEVVTRKALIDEVWGERYVSDEVLTQAIKELRHALGDSSSKPQYIQTIPKRGYQLLQTAYPVADSLPERAYKAIQKNTLVSVLIVAAAVVAVVAFKVGKIEPEDPATVENSIAVLPFEVCERSPQDLVLAMSISDEVINRLSERNKLKVIARSSVIALAVHDLSVLEIAKPLGAQYVLKGVVCRNGDTPMLTAELSDAQGFIVWSNTFIQEVNEFDQVTNRLASQVASKVAGELGDAVAMEHEAPVDSRAYEQLLIGRQYGRQGKRKDARERYQRALEFDPGYVEPKLELAVLARTQDRIGLKDGTGLNQARALAEEALAMAQRELTQFPRSAKAHSLTGKLLFALGSWDRELLWRESANLSESEVSARKEAIRLMFESAEHHFSSAISLNPSQTDFYYDLAFAVEGQGRERDAEALEILERALVRDPLNERLLGRIAKRWAARGQFRQAIELLEKLKALPEIPTSAWWWQLELMQLQMYWDEKVETLIDMLLHDPKAFEKDLGNRWQAWWTVSVLAWLGLYEEAEAWKIRLENMEMTQWMREWGLNHYLSATGRLDERAQRTLDRFTDMSDAQILDAFHEWGMSFAIALAHSDELDRAIGLMESAQHAPGFWAEREIEPMLRLSAMYQAAGREREAQDVLNKVVNYLEAEYDAGIRHPQTLHNLAQAYARQGRDDEALEMLRNAVDYHWRGTALFDTGILNAVWNSHAESSAWFRLRKDPRFITLIDRMQADLDQQAARVRSMLANHDIDELLSPLMVLVPSTDPGKEQTTLGTPLD